VNLGEAERRTGSVVITYATLNTRCPRTWKGYAAPLRDAWPFLFEQQSIM